MNHSLPQATEPVPFFIEPLRPLPPGAPIRAALFDFDGTLSLIRGGWQHVMIPMMVETLQRETSTTESAEELEAVVTEFVVRLTGRQTIYQMIQLAEEVRKRGGRPRDPLEYKRLYHARLLKRIGYRRDGLRDGTISVEQMTIPGTFELLSLLRQRGVTLYLASGTDLQYVREELALLKLTPYFEPHIYGALDEYRLFSKRKIIQRILREQDLSGPELLGVGDGFVEIEEVVRVGGIAVGVASDELCRGGFSAWKRQRLKEAGAHLIVPHYADAQRLVEYLWTERDRRRSCTKSSTGRDC